VSSAAAARLFLFSMILLAKQLIGKDISSTTRNFRSPDGCGLLQRSKTPHRASEKITKNAWWL
jgi:hypothetical protein